MNDSSITYDAQGRARSFNDPDAVAVYQAVVLASSIRMYAKGGIIPSRGVTITRMLKAASAITGKPYRPADKLQAIDDLLAWKNTMVAALPHDEVVR